MVKQEPTYNTTMKPTEMTNNNKQTYVDYLGWFFVGFGFGLLTTSIMWYLTLM